MNRVKGPIVTAIIKLPEIKQSLTSIDLIQAMEQGFIQYSNGNTVVPPVAELLFDEPKGDTHIKYGYIKNDDYYVIKIASGFYQNPQLGLASSQGLMLLFDQKTGVPCAVLLDEGYLTDIRTAAAGALVAKYFAPKQLKAVGIIGTGIQARQQLLQLQALYQTSDHGSGQGLCKELWIWGRNDQSAQTLASEFSDSFDVKIAQSPAQVAAHANLIVTTTPSEIALLNAADIQAGTHITAVGADTEQKQELDSKILTKADIVISDSIAQSKSRGEIYQALKVGAIDDRKVIELGTAIQDSSLMRVNDQQITVADLTGVAVQDIMVANAVYQHYLKTNNGS
ncbi:MAG: putative cyclodeaminase [Osedax symbiont Rs2]|nr:MAG: putative cyclodeaminase [Osedax symbiont Rs2]